MAASRRVTSLLAGTLAFATNPSPTASQTPPTFPAGVELVRIDVVVLDHGRPVTDLNAADFEVTENGRPHDIVSFEPIVVRPTLKPMSVEPATPARATEPLVSVPEENRWFLIFFDDVHVSAPAAERVREQLVPFLEREMRDDDWVTITSPLAGLRWTARTAYEHRQLPAVIRGLKGQLVRNPLGGPTDFDAMRTAEYEGRGPMDARGPNSQFTPSKYLLAEETYAVAKRRIRRSLTGLSEAIVSMSGFRGRKSLIFYSEGFVKSPSMPDYDRTIELAQRARVAVYFADPRGLGSGLPMSGGNDGGPTLIQLDTEAGGSSYVATATGGRASISNDVTALLHEAAVESSAYYLLGFYPSAGPSGARKLKVRVRRQGVTVRAPDRYIAGEPAPASTPVPPAVQALGLVSDATDIRLRVSTLFLDTSPKGEVTTTLAVELERGDGVDAPRELNLLIEARPLDHGEPVRDTAEMRVLSGGRAAVATRELHLRPGVWQARVVVRDTKTEKLGSALHTFEVPSGAGLRMSSPILADELESSRPPRPRLRLDRRYRAGSAFYCQYRVLGAALDATTRKPRVSASYAIVRAGHVIKDGPPSAIEPTGDGHLLRLLGFGLAGFEPGDYTLVLRATDEVSGRRCETAEPFTIIPAEG